MTGIIATPIVHTHMDGESLGRCTLAVPRSKHEGRWETADHIPLLFPPPLLPLPLSRGGWLDIQGRIVTYTGYSGAGIRQSLWSVYVTHINSIQKSPNT